MKEYDETVSDGAEESADAVQGETSIVLIAVRFRPKWPPYHYNASEIPVKDGEWVVVPTEHGVEVGRVLGRPVVIRMPMKALPPQVIRLASTHEIELFYRNLDREKAARDLCMDRIRVHALSMKLVRVESYFDGNKIIFFYSAEGRVDFRELVKDLVKSLRTRVEMRQIGIRHEAKMIGGIGSCGREFCCASFLNDFAPVSIKMAKGQNLPLNPNKISGICGRLLCCLTYEYGTYLELAKEMPAIGRLCDTPAGQGKVVRRNIIRDTVTVVLSDSKQVEFSTEELEKFVLQRGKEAGSPSVGRSIPHSPKRNSSKSVNETEKETVDVRNVSEDVAVPTGEGSRKKDSRPRKGRGGTKRRRSKSKTNTR